MTEVEHVDGDVLNAVEDVEFALHVAQDGQHDCETTGFLGGHSADPVGGVEVVLDFHEAEHGVGFADPGSVVLGVGAVETGPGGGFGVGEHGHEFSQFRSGLRVLVGEEGLDAGQAGSDGGELDAVLGVEVIDVGGGFEFGGHAVGVGLGLGVGDGVVRVGEDLGDAFFAGADGGGDQTQAVRW